jgi:hypothetical protein
MIVGGSPTAALDVTLTVRPADPPPGSVMMVAPDGGQVALVEAPPTTFKTSIKEGPETIFRDYEFVASWPPDKNQQFVVRFFRGAPASLDLIVSNNELDPSTGGIAKLVEGRDLLSLMQRYFDARDMYRRAPNKKHDAAQAALSVWAEAAFELAKRFRWVAIDLEVISEVEQNAKPDRTRLLKRARELRGLFMWQRATDIVAIEGLERPDWALAARLVNELIAEWENSTPEERGEVPGVTLDWLREHSRLIENNCALCTAPLPDLVIPTGSPTQ